MTTETVMRSFPADLLARMDQISEDRPIGDIQPGWWIRTVREDQTREWIRVTLRLEGTGMRTRQKIVELSGISPDEPDCLVDIGAYLTTQPICCITKAQARKLGLTDPRTDTAAEETRQ